MRVPSTQGVYLEVHELGGAGEPLLICHATGFNGMSYEPMARHLGDDFRVFAMDFRGHGDSSAPDGKAYEWEGMAADATAVAAAIGEPRLHVFGHSMGGAAAMAAQASQPGIFSSAYLYEPIILPGAYVMPADNYMASAARKRREVFPSKEAALARYASRPPMNELQAGSLAAYVEHGFQYLDDGSVRLKCRAETEASVFEASGSITIEMMADIDIPVTVATGGEKDSMLVALAAPLTAGIAGSRHRIFDHLGHFGPLQDPASVAASLARSVKNSQSAAD